MKKMKRCLDALAAIGKWVKIRGSVQRRYHMRDLAMNAYDIVEVAAMKGTQKEYRTQKVINGLNSCAFQYEYDGCDK